MTRQKKPPRPPIPEAIVAEVVYASDMACCICRKPHSFRDIHHIDEDRTNNDPANLAVVCKECHTEIHTHRDFARKFTSATVTKYRDAWLEMVKEKRRIQAGLPAAPAAPVRAPRRKMTPEQARDHARRLRELYAPFSQGIEALQSYANEMSRAWGIETWDARAKRLSPSVHDALQKIGTTLPQIRVEPGSQGVCDAYDEFRDGYSAYLNRIKDNYEGILARFNDPDHPYGILFRWGTDTLQRTMNDSVSALQAAIRKHVASMDRLA